MYCILYICASLFLKLQVELIVHKGPCNPSLTDAMWLYLIELKKANAYENFHKWLGKLFFVVVMFNFLLKQCSVCVFF